MRVQMYTVYMGDGGDRNESDPLEPELQAITCDPAWVLGTSSLEVLLTAEPSFQAHKLFPNVPFRIYYLTRSEFRRLGFVTRLCKLPDS